MAADVGPRGAAGTLEPTRGAPRGFPGGPRTGVCEAEPTAAQRQYGAVPTAGTHASHGLLDGWMACLLVVHSACRWVHQWMPCEIIAVHVPLLSLTSQVSLLFLYY
ncbi:hypothetical protein V2G26_013784 [Clonostachys chloroleuca]